MFEKKSTEYWTSLVLAGLVRSIMHQTSPVLDSVEAKHHKLSYLDNKHNLEALKHE
jgi:hypothetical protein